MKMMAKLGGDDPFLAIAPDRLPHESFRSVIAIALGCVDQVNAHLPALIQNLARFISCKLLTPFPTKLPGADANYRSLQSRAAERSIFHLAQSFRLHGRHTML